MISVTCIGTRKTAMALSVMAKAPKTDHMPPTIRLISLFGAATSYLPRKAATP